MPNLEDFKNPDGTLDVPAYNRAYTEERKERKAKGELCYDCGAFLIWPSGGPRKCDTCQAREKPEAWNSHQEVRCPSCGYHWNVWDASDYDLMKDGPHDVSCPDCEADFEVETSVSFTFRSPERAADKTDEKGRAE